MRDISEQEKSRECSFRPEISLHIEQDIAEKEVNEIKGIDKFLARQKAANEAKRMKEKYKLRGPILDKRNRTPNELRRTKGEKLSVQSIPDDDFEDSKKRIHSDIQSIFI